MNNDGLLDIYVSCELYDDQPKLRTNKLYINKGNFEFDELAAKWNVDVDEEPDTQFFLITTTMVYLIYIY